MKVAAMFPTARTSLFVHSFLQNWDTVLTSCDYCVQSNWPAGQYAAVVVAVHLAFALLEKQRLENFEEKGEVMSAQTCLRAFPTAKRSLQPSLQLLSDRNSFLCYLHEVACATTQTIPSSLSQ